MQIHLQLNEADLVTAIMDYVVAKGYQKPRNTAITIRKGSSFVEGDAAAVDDFSATVIVDGIDPG